MSAPVIRPYDAAWPVLAVAWLEKIEASLAGVAESSSFRYEHIGSTAVPGLAAKPIIDLQMRAARLPAASELQRALAPLGLSLTAGSRFDSPGVYFDIPRPGTDQDPEKHRKHLFFSPERSSPGSISPGNHSDGNEGTGNEGKPAVILHVRRHDSPFAEYVTAFRDWLCANPDEARNYEAVKRSLAAEHGSATDYDDYTRAKTAFLDEAQTKMGQRTG